MGVLYLILIAVVLVGGTLVLRVLTRPRRRGTTPHCARCDYILIGLTGDRCPECGTEITPANTVYGERVRRPRLAAVAATIAIITVIPISRWAWNYDWYRVKPTSWVLNDLSSTNAAAKSRAWTELDRRGRTGSLSKSHQSRLIDVCLVEQAAPSPATAMIDHLGSCLTAGRMSPSQQATFFTQLVQAQLWVRPRVVAGAELLPIRFAARSRGPSQGLWIRLDRDGVVRLDGHPAKRPQGWRRNLMLRGVSGGGYHENVVLFSEWDDKARPGAHRLGTTVQIEVFVDGASGRQNDKSGRLYQAELSLKAEFEILPTEPADYIRLIDDPSLKRALQNAIRPKKLRLAPHADRVNFELELRNVPVGVAFDALIRTNGRVNGRYTVHVAKGESADWNLAATEVPASQPFDLVLRTNKVVAKNTVDLFEIWQGELIYADLRVESSEQPAASRSSP